MKAGEVLALGRFQPDDLLVSISTSTRKIDPEIEGQVDAIWEAKKKKADEEGRVCYNGISYRLNSFNKEGDKLRIDFGTLEFKARVALPTIPGYFELPDEYFRKGCYAGATVRTSDDKYLMVELSGKSMNTNPTDVLGGILEESIEINTGADVFKTLYAELEEEGIIHESDIEESYLRAIYLEARTNVGFYFEVILNVSSAELIERFHAESEDQDIKSLIALSKDEYMTILKNHNAESKQLIAEFMTL